MVSEIEIPTEIPVMTLSDMTLFPQAMMPLYIFEPRYRHMLQDVLTNERIFAVAGLDDRNPDGDALEPPHRVAGIGIVRACRKNPDGTSNLILQGLARVELTEIVSEEPYRRARIKALPSRVDGSEKTLEAIQPSILGLVQTLQQLGAAIPNEVVSFLSNVTDPEGVLDLAIYTLCASPELKQKLLETSGILERYESFGRYLQARIDQLKLDNKLKGDLSEDDLGQN